jgi:hypothetical protein
LQGDPTLRLCYNSPISHPTPGAPQSSEQDAKMVTFHTNHGDIVIKTFDDKAPETVKTSWTTAVKVSTTTLFSTVLSTVS